MVCQKLTGGLYVVRAGESCPALPAHVACSEIGRQGGGAIAELSQQCPGCIAFRHDAGAKDAGGVTLQTVRPCQCSFERGEGDGAGLLLGNVDEHGECRNELSMLSQMRFKSRGHTATA
jgi:hypothetical protein